MAATRGFLSRPRGLLVSFTAFSLLLLISFPQQVEGSIASCSYEVNNQCQEVCGSMCFPNWSVMIMMLISIIITCVFSLQCDDGWTVSPDSKSCLKCKTKNCISCSGTDPNVCTLCSRGMGLSGNTCIPCKVEFCAECGINAAKCTGCGLDPKKNIYYDISWKTGKGTCVACGKNERTCIGNKNCVLGYFLDKPSNTCKACPSNCEYCSSTTTCTYCNDGYGVGSDGTCVKGSANFETEALSPSSSGFNLHVHAMSIVISMGVFLMISPMMMWCYYYTDVESSCLRVLLQLTWSCQEQHV